MTQVEDARREAVGHLRRDAHLVRQQVDAATSEAMDRRLAVPVLMGERLDAQVVEAWRIDLPREQTLERPVEAETIAQLGFADLMAAAGVIAKPVALA